MSLLRRIERVQKAAEPEKSGPAKQSSSTARRASPPAAARPSQQPPSSASREEYLRHVEARLKDEVIGASDSLVAAETEDVRGAIGALVDRISGASGFALTLTERLRLTDELVAEVVGFGPIEPLLHDETVTEIMVNGPNQVYIERHGRLELTDVVFANDEHVMRIIDRIIAPMGRRIDDSSPRVDARLPDGSRVNAIIAPLSLIGPVITVRKFAAKPITVDDMIRFGTATPEMFDFLRACVEARLNIFVSGGTGSGKTTFLNVLSSFIPDDDRIVTIEDAAELQLRQEHVIALESRPTNLEGKGEITIRDLVHNSLHMRPDRIIVGECRAGEALDMIQAMTVGHEGSMSTGHANTPQDMLRRLETMVLMSGFEMPLRTIREQITSAVDLIVHTARLKDGSRKVVNITEVYGIDDDTILLQDIFVFEQTGVRDGKIEGALKPTGIRPTFMWKFYERGIELPPDEFGIPPFDPGKPGPPRKGRARTTSAGTMPTRDPSRPPFGYGRAVRAGGMVYLSSIGPVDPETGELKSLGIIEQTRQCLHNVKARLEAEGSSLASVVWANWSLREPSEFDEFNEEWVRWFPGDSPVGQGTLMPPLQRRAGFRISLGVIAEAGERPPTDEPEPAAAPAPPPATAVRTEAAPAAAAPKRGGGARRAARSNGKT